MNISILVRDDLVRASIAYLLQSFDTKFTFLEGESSSDSFIRKISPEKIDLFIIDSPFIDHVSLAQTVQFIKKRFKQVPIVGLFDALDKINMQQCYNSGINGYVEKSSCKNYLQMIVAEANNNYYIPPSISNLQPANNISGASSKLKSKLKSSNKNNSEIRLTSRQEEILFSVKQGKSNKEISRLLGLSEGTVRTHVTHIFTRLNVTNRTEAVYVATKQGFL